MQHFIIRLTVLFGKFAALSTDEGLRLMKILLHISWNWMRIVYHAQRAVGEHYLRISLRCRYELSEQPNNVMELWELERQRPGWLLRYQELQESFNFHRP